MKLWSSIILELLITLMGKSEVCWLFDNAAGRLVNALLLCEDAGIKQ